MKPSILMPAGYHNDNLDESIERLEKEKLYRDLSTIIICPTRGLGIAPRIVTSWMNLIRPMNGNVQGPHFAQGLEVGEAYNQLIANILAHPNLCNFKYILTIEEDNSPPPDGLKKLYQGMDEFDVIGGLYWTKGVEGQPMIYGNPDEFPANFRPQKPIPNTLQRANGLGMGFNLFKLEMFKKIPEPWFKTIQEYDPATGVRLGTQDLYFYQKAAQYGYKFACDTRVLVGHYSIDDDFMW